jgi:radical SAM protein with 4Fe4S-binding SPASM domain
MPELLQEWWELMMDIPHGVNLETLAHCNAKCIMCPISSMTMPKGTMNDELFTKIVDEVSVFRGLPGWGNVMSVHGTGEPTLYKRLPARIESLTKLGIQVKLTTNGSLMNEKTCRAILNAGVDTIEFSIESLDKEIYERIRVGLDLDEVVDNFVTCCRIRDELRPQTHVCWMFVNHSETNAGLQNAVNFFSKHARHGDFLTAHPRHNFGGKFPENRIDGPDHWCWQAVRMFNILYDGTVNMCCVDDDNTTTFGNVSDNSILQIYNSEKYLKFRQEHQGGGRRNNPICAVCNVPEASLQAQYFTF